MQLWRGRAGRKQSTHYQYSHDFAYHSNVIQISHMNLLIVCKAMTEVYCLSHNKEREREREGKGREGREGREGEK